LKFSERKKRCEAVARDAQREALAKLVGRKTDGKENWREIAVSLGMKPQTLSDVLHARNGRGFTEDQLLKILG